MNIDIIEPTQTTRDMKKYIITLSIEDNFSM